MRPATLLIALCACSEYEVTKQGDDPEPAFDTGDTVDPGLPGEPELSVTPEAVTEDAVCGTRAVTVTVANVGDEDLHVSSLALEGDVSGSLPTTPLTLAPDEALPIALDVAPGNGALRIVSDDADEGDWRVPIAATGDTAPELSIRAPSAGDVLDVGATVALTSHVADDADLPEDVALAWVSDVDGAIGAPLADATGAAALDWSADGRSPGSHVLTLTATDSCGNVSTATVGVCQQAGYDEESLDLSGWHFEGAANWDATNGWVELTTPANNVVGAAFQTSAAVTGDAVSVEFQFYMGGGSGADGFAVTALDTDRMTAYLASAGGCLGFGYDGSGCPNPAAALPGWTIEVDTWQNSQWDPTADDHVAFMFDGAMYGIEAWAALPEMEDNGWHTMVVDVSAPRVTVSIDGVAYIDQDIPGDYAFPAYVGFSAATGGSTNYHLIDALTVTEYVCEE